MSDMIDRLRQDLHYSVSAPAEQIYADIQQLREFDRENEKQESTWGWVGCGGVMCIVAGVAAVFILFEQGLAPVGIGVGVLGLVVAIVGFAFKMKYGRFNLDDVRYELLGELVRLLDTDMGENEPFQVKVDFTPHNDQRHFVRKGKAGHWNAKYYNHSYLELGGRLLDGSKFSLAMIEKQQDRHRYKTNARGKVKSKSKTKSGGEAAVIVKVKETRYPRFAQNAEQLQSAVQVPPGVEADRPEPPGGRRRRGRECSVTCCPGWACQAQRYERVLPAARTLYR